MNRDAPTREAARAGMRGAVVIGAVCSLVLLLASTVLLVGTRPGDALADVESVQAVPDMRININTADAATLRILPGIGPSRAEAIIAHREQFGPWRKIDDLL
ncbi:MAG: helix-hairpin-helix domain-containing protein, partial [Phycisphaerales bacterium]|nr:helix-hairpin-helix domain-containing protein [Phycisphaerales bacterium]